MLQRLLPTAVIVSLVCLGVVGRSCGQSTVPLPKGLKTSNETLYSIKMETTFETPNDKTKIEQIRVYHALPTLHAWSKADAKYGAREVQYDTKIGKLETHSATQSQHLLFTLNPVQKPGTKFTFTTTMKIVSVDRTFDTTLKMAWSDFKGTYVDKAAVVNQQVKGNIPPELKKIADELKAKHTPPEAVRQMAIWVKDNIKYDAAVPYEYKDVTNIVKFKKGHCGHQSTIFEYLTAAVGIPMRTAWGMNLYAPDGRTGELQKVRADYTNIHTWAEVYFPGIGWIEVDPNLGEKAMSLPSHLIQNNRWFQNYSIWFRENGRDKQPTWTDAMGGFRSDYGVEHIISYSKGKGKK